MGQFSNFKDYMRSLKGQYGNYSRLILETTADIFTLTREPVRPEMVQLNPRLIIPGQFYLLRYNFNGNLIWCPVLTLEKRVIKNKPLMFALNLEYIPTAFKIELFDRIFRAYQDILGKNEEQPMAQQRALPLNFETIYRLLKDGHKEYAITAFDLSKIRTLHWVSTNLAPHFLMCNTFKYNANSMKELYLSQEGPVQLKVGEILAQYEQILQGYQENSEAFHRQLKAFEQNLKLFPNEQ